MSDVPAADLVLRNAKVVTFTARRRVRRMWFAAPDLELERDWKR